MYRLRVKKQGQIILVVGNPMVQMGNGKTSAAVALARVLDRHGWGVAKIEYKLEPLLRLVDKMRDDAAIHHKYYQVAILDEGQVSMANDEWFTALSKAIFQVATVFRKSRCCLIIIVPRYSFILAKIRHLINILIIPNTELDENGKLIGTFKIFQLTHDIFTDKTMLMSLKFYNDKDKQICMVGRVIFKLPPPDLQREIDRKEDIEKAAIHDNALQAAIAYDKSLTKEPPKEMKDMIDFFVNNKQLRSEFLAKGKIEGAAITDVDHNIKRVDGTYFAAVVNRILKREVLNNGIKPVSQPLGTGV
jgi:hypothetical protein